MQDRDLDRFVNVVDKAQDLLAQSLAVPVQLRTFTAQDVADLQMQLDDLAKALRVQK